MSSPTPAGNYFGNAASGTNTSLAIIVVPGSQLLVVELAMVKSDGSPFTVAPTLTVSTSAPVLGTPLTLLLGNNQGSIYSAVYYRINPTSGGQTISVVSDVGVEIIIIAQSYNNVNTAIPFASSVATTGVNNVINLPPAGPVTTQQLVVDAIAVANNTTPIQAFSPVIPGETFSRTNNPSGIPIAEYIFVRDPATQNSSYTYGTIPQTAAQGITFAINGPLVCLDGATMVSMADGTEKPIRDIKRGDFVFGNKEKTIINQVAQLNITTLTSDYKIDVVKINKGSLGNGLPTKDLIGTDPHPIIWNGVRKPLRCFVKFPGVAWLKENPPMAKDILSADADGNYAIYDIVFDHDGDYIANGVQVQAHSPWCRVGWLPKELYFNPNNYREKRSWKCQAHPLPWNDFVIDL